MLTAYIKFQHVIQVFINSRKIRDENGNIILIYPSILRFESANMVYDLWQRTRLPGSTISITGTDISMEEGHTPTLTQAVPQTY